MKWRTIIVSAVVTSIVTCLAITVFLVLFAGFAPVQLAPVLKNPSGKRGLLFFITGAFIFAVPSLINAAIIFLTSKQHRLSQTFAAGLMSLTLSGGLLFLLGLMFYLLRALIRMSDPPVGPG